jgi:large subunit ribosomal protein L24
MPQKKQAPPPNKIRFKKGDMVKVIAGKDRGKSGRIIEVDRERGRLIVEGIMMLKRHTKPNPAKQIKGGVAEKEGTIHVSNVMAMTSTGIVTRIGYRLEKTASGAVTKTRIARKNLEMLGKA